MKKYRKEVNKKSKKIRKGDKVVVIAGNSKGLTGQVMQVRTEHVVVQGVNMRKRHVKPTQQNPKGGVVEIEAPIHVSNVAICDEQGKRLKLKVERDATGEGKLYWMNGSEKVIYRSLKTPK